MKGQYRTARRIYGATHYRNLWLVETAGTISAIEIDDPQATPETVDLNSIARDNGWSDVAIAYRIRAYEGAGWWGWALSSGKWNCPLENATRAVAVEHVLGAVDGTLDKSRESRP